MTNLRTILCLLIPLGPPVQAEDWHSLFEQRGFLPSNISISQPFPIAKLKSPKVHSISKFQGFPEGPSYRPKDDSLFFAGNVGLRQLRPDGSLMTILQKPSGGGTHFLADGSILHLGHQGLRRIFSDGRIQLISDIAGGNDITIGIHREIYFSVPKKGIFRVTPGKKGTTSLVSKNGCNGLDVDPSGKFLYVHRAGIRRYPIEGPDKPLGPEEVVHQFPKGHGGADGCTFDAWGHLYSVQFARGAVIVIDPTHKKQIADIDLPVKPASNLTFGGPKNDTLFLTAGAPRQDNCQILRIDLGITGFPGHPGATDYPVMKELEERAKPFKAALSK